MKSQDRDTDRIAAALPDILRNSARRATLERTSLLDSPTEEAFDRVTRLATKILRVPVALVSLVDGDRQFFKSCIGLPAPWDALRETPLSHSFCQYQLATREPLIIPDAREHPLVQDNLAIQDLGVIAYAGIPLITSDGQVLGSLCVIDHQPRDWQPEEIDILKDLSATVVTEIELRLTNQEVRRQAAEAEHERHEKTAVFERIADAFYALDTEWRFTYLNQHAERLLQRRREELLGQNFWEAFPEATQLRLYSEYHRAVAKQTTVTFEEYYAARNSWMEVYAYPAEDGLSVYLRDITERKQAEQRRTTQYAISDLLASAASLAETMPQVLQTIGEGLGWDYGAFWTLNQQSGVLSCAATWHSRSATFAVFDANTRQQTLQRGAGLPGRVLASGAPDWISDVIQDANFPRAAAAAKEDLHGAFAFPIWLGHTILGVAEFFSREIRAPDPDLLQYVGALGTQLGQFIERAQAIVALRESEARKRAVLETALDGIITIDSAGRVVEWNPAAEQIFGYCHTDVIGQDLANLIIPPRLRQQHYKGMEHYLATGDGPVLGRRIELPAIRANGEEFPVELAITRIPIEGPALFTGYIRDITEHKRAEEERAQLLASEQAARTAAQEAVRLRDTFLSIASHELKTPLTSLLGNAQLLQRRAARGDHLTDRDQRALTVIAKQASRLNKMITTLLDISRLEAGQLSIERVPLDLGALARRVVEEAQPMLERHTITYTRPAEPLLVAGDELRLEQVLQNLIQNAIKYSPNGGLISVHAYQEGTKAYISITDQGVGIPEAAIPQLFQRFYRAENVSNTHIPGMGIGLFVVKEIVGLHGGDLAVESVEGQGSTFTFYLPLADVA